MTAGRFVPTIPATIFLLLLCALPAAAEDRYRDVESASAQEIVDGMSNRMVRGVANIATGWLEFPKQIYLEGKNSGIVKGVFVGPLKGIGMTLVRTVSGAGEVLTFFIPPPGFYEPWLEPKFVWQPE